MVKKAPDAFRTISEVSDALDTPAHVLRFWESKFSQIKPVKRAGGRRYYRPDDINLLSGIKTVLHEQGMTIKGAQKLLREKGVKHVAAIAPIVITEAASKPKPAARKKTKAKKVIKADVVEAVEEPIIDAPAEPTPALDVAQPDLPALDLPEPAVQPGVMAALATMDRTALRGKSSKLAPIVARLQDLQSRMSAA